MGRLGQRLVLADAVASLEDTAADVVLRALAPVLDEAAVRLAGSLPVGLTAAEALTAASTDELAQILTAWGVAVDAEVLPFYAEVYAAGGLAAVAQVADLGREVTTTAAVSDLMDEAAARHLAGARNRFLAVGDRAWREARTIMLAGLEQGRSVDAIAAELHDVVGLARAQATMIARTEVIAAANAGSVKRVDLMGADAPGYRQWLATLDARTRRSHARADGQVVARDQPFIVGGAALGYPADPAGPADEVINCRCSVLFIDDPEGGVAGVEGRQEGGVVDDVEPMVAAAASQLARDLAAHYSMTRSEVIAALGLGEPAGDAAVNVNPDGTPHTGAMIALIPTDGDLDRLAVEGGEPREQLHLTLWFLGDAVDIPDGLRAAVLDGVETAAGGLPPVTGDAFAADLFNPGGDDPAWVIGVSGGELRSTRDALLDVVALATTTDDAAGEPWGMPEQHDPWVPHITLAYSGDQSGVMLAEATARLGPVTFDRVRVAYGAEVADFPLGGGGEPSTGPGQNTAVTTTAAAEGAAGQEDTTMPDDVAATGLAADLAAVEDVPLTEVPAIPGEHFHAVAHIEGTSTGRRTFTNLTWREPPFAFHDQYSSSAHGGQPMTRQVGLVTRVVRDPANENVLHSFGTLDLGGAEGRDYGRRLIAGFARWVSIGLDEQPYDLELVWPDDMPEGEAAELLAEPEQVLIDGGCIGELTGVSVPAQADATIEPTADLIQALGQAQTPGEGQETPLPAEGDCPPGTAWDERVGECVPVDDMQSAGPGAQPAPAPGEDGGCPPGFHLMEGECMPDEDMPDAAAGRGPLVVEQVAGTISVRRRSNGSNGSNGSAEVGDAQGHFESGRVDNSAWDGNAAMSSCSDADCYRSIAAGERSTGDPSERQHWALPHHKTPGGPPNAGGVRAALSRLSSTEGLTNTDAARNHLEKHLATINADDAETAARTAQAGATFADAVQALTAAAYRIEIPNLPPAAWFDEPTDVEIPGAFCVTDDGRIYGVLAPLGVGHRAYAASGRRVEVPNGTVDYSRFLGGEALTADGRIGGVGPITMDCGHAPRYREDGHVAPAHYENACTVVGKVRVGETASGLPWVAGALEPGVTPDQLSRMLACRLSGDWQPHADRPGWQELVAALLVPSPGFPMGRTGPTTTLRDGVLVASSMPVRHVPTPRPAATIEPGDPAEVEAAAAAAGRTPWARRAARLNRLMRSGS